MQGADQDQGDDEGEPAEAQDLGEEAMACLSNFLHLLCSVNNDNFLFQISDKVILFYGRAPTLYQRCN